MPLAAVVLALVAAGLVLVDVVVPRGRTTPAGGAAVEAVRPDRAAFALPLDAYIDRRTADARYAEDLGVRACAAARGVDYPVDHRTTRVDGNASWNPVGRLLFTPATAGRFGYHQQIGAGGLSEAEIRRELDGPDVDDQVLPIVDRCRRDVRHELGTDAEIDTLPTALAIRAYDAALRQGDVVAAASRWRACLAGRIDDEPGRTPAGMPTAVLRHEFGLDRDAPPTEAASAREKRIALADARCREGSGYSEIAYEAEWRYQETLLRANEDALDEVARRVAERDSRVRAAVARWADAGPQPSGLP